MSWKRPMIWRVSCRLRHTWILRSMQWDGMHRITEYECNFCDAKQTTIDYELDREADGIHPLCQLGVHEWDNYCGCYCTSDQFCARFCGMTRKFSHEQLKEKNHEIKSE